jgi:hypothetical protein
MGARPGDCEREGNVVGRGASAVEVPGEPTGGPDLVSAEPGGPADHRAVHTPGPGGAARDQALLALARPDQRRQNTERQGARS